MTEALGAYHQPFGREGGLGGDNVEMTNLGCGSPQTRKISKFFP